MPSKPIKILHVVFSLQPGGMENGIVNLARALKPEEFEVHVCCLERGGVFVERLPQPEKVHVIGRKPGFSFSAAFGLARLIRKINPDLIHCHNLGPLIYSGLSTCFGLTRPLLQGEHSLLTGEECSPRRIRQRKLLYNGCRKIHTVSEGLRQQLIQLGFPAKKIVTLLNGVDAKRFVPGPRPAARKQLCLPEEGFIIGIVGRFGPFKRHGLLIEAFNNLAKQRPDIHLLIVGGGGPEEDRVRTQGMACEAASRIHFSGFQNNLPLYYQAMDLLVVPSINEGLSNAVLEAMSCGTPVLANNTCGNGEIITSGRDSIVADLGTEEKLRCELQKVLVETAQLDKMGQTARESVVQKFSLTKMVSEYEQLYREVARRERPDDD